jgi:hypothetical protein
MPPKRVPLKCYIIDNSEGTLYYLSPSLLAPDGGMGGSLQRFAWDRI